MHCKYCTPYHTRSDGIAVGDWFKVTKKDFFFSGEKLKPYRNLKLWHNGGFVSIHDKVVVMVIDEEKDETNLVIFKGISKRSPNSTLHPNLIYPIRVFLISVHIMVSWLLFLFLVSASSSNKLPKLTNLEAEIILCNYWRPNQHAKESDNRWIIHLFHFLFKYLNVTLQKNLIMRIIFAFISFCLIFFQLCYLSFILFN